jgi:transcriptional regulator with XRE-family HTH domain
MEQANTIGARVREIRKRRGLSQRELATRARVSPSLIKSLEQGTYGDMRLETARRLAAALDVETIVIMAGHEEPPDTQPDTRAAWGGVRRALNGDHGEPEAAEEPTILSVRQAFGAAVADVLDSRYAGVRLMLPPILRDADDLVTASSDGAEADARRLRSQARQLGAYMLGQTRQFGAAGEAIDLAADDADDPLTAAAAADWKSWILIRQGRLGDALELAERWADDAEPRVTRATPEEFAAWGRFQLRVTAAAIRDNRPGEAAEALRFARIAAAGTGHDIIPSFNRWQVFGPATVAMFQAQNAVIEEHPETALRIGRRLEGQRFPLAETWNRHRLDVAQAHVLVREHAEAVEVLQEIRQAAPEWLVQQRYARDILAAVVGQRRTLTSAMRDLADAVGLPL